MGTAVAVVLSVLCALSVAPRFRPRPSQILNGAELMFSVARHPRLSDSERVLGAGGNDSAWKLVYEDENERKLLSYLRAATNRFDPIFVGVKDQSRVFFNNLRIYWLADRPIGVRAFQLETQVATEAVVQREQIADLEQNRVSWIVLDGLQTTGDLAFWRRGYQGSTDFDEYVSSHYVEVARLVARCWERHDSPGCRHRWRKRPGGLSLARSIR